MITYRPPEDSDLPALTALFNTVLADEGYPDRFDEQYMRDEMHAPGRDSRVDDLLAVDSAGELVGFIAIIPPPPDGEYAYVQGGVHPDWRRQGIGHQLVDWALRRVTKLHAEAGATKSWKVHFGAVDSNTTAADLLTAAGLEPVRYWYEMERPVDAPIPDSPITAGLSLVTFTPDRAEALHAAHTEAFRDHYAYQPRPFETWWGHLSESSGFRPQQTVLAVAGDGSVGGYLISFGFDDPARLIMGTIGVRRPWRRKGVASALMAHALSLYAAAGASTAALDVDTANPSGAVSVYERMGFASTIRSVTWERTVTS